ncbi:hypothetical protein FQA47_012444 [Oryzias melastigma]|uniref:Uncharacterized protein n=1 Tax=Oryzias melastigma TaxID=30732 RepID=A0A834F2B8_ORYME|nr:hypothetical protein FQA47_012444 [Oryzias melastigma]
MSLRNQATGLWQPDHRLAAALIGGCGQVAEFLIESHIFPKKYFEPSGRFHLPQWSNVPGINILEHIYREDPDRKMFLHYKMIVQPRLVQQTSVHEVLRKFGKRYKVPWNLCRFIHIHVPRRTSLKLEELNEDKRLWDFQEKLIPNLQIQPRKLVFFRNAFCSEKKEFHAARLLPVAEFLIESHIFPKKYFEPSGRFHLPQWSNVPGINILEHIYREDPDRKKFLHYKMIVQPKLVQQTSVHEVLKKYGKRYKVPWDLCRFIHVHVARRTSLKLEELKEDKRLWDFQEKLIPNERVSVFRTVPFCFILTEYKVAVFILESHVFPKIYFDPSERFRLPQWSNVSGINILEHIYREDPDRKKFLHFKMIVQPKRVEQTSVHDVLRKFGGSLRVPWKLCRFIHIHVPRRTSLKLEELKVDKRLWDFQEKLIPNVDKALQRAGLLTES